MFSLSAVCEVCPLSSFLYILYHTSYCLSIGLVKVFYFFLRGLLFSLFLSVFIISQVRQFVKRFSGFFYCYFEQSFTRIFYCICAFCTNCGFAARLRLCVARLIGGVARGWCSFDGLLLAGYGL